MHAWVLVLLLASRELSVTETREDFIYIYSSEKKKKKKEHSYKIAKS